MLEIGARIRTRAGYAGAIVGEVSGRFWLVSLDTFAGVFPYRASDLKLEIKES